MTRQGQWSDQGKIPAPTTIKQAAELWLFHIENRKRKPAKLSSIFTFKSHIRAHILPALEHVEIPLFGNAKMKEFVSYLAEKNLSPATIRQISNTVRHIVASVVDQNGDELFPRKWNSEFIDAPIVESQKQPTVTPAQIEEAISKASETDGILYTLLAASGLRIGEALSLRIGPSASSYFADGAITVRTSLWRRREQTPKTIAAIRTVELAGPAAKCIAEFAKGRTGFLFGNGVAPSESAFRDRLSDTGIKGFHALRRFRVTHLRKSRVQEDLIRWWLGHSAGSITDGYSKLSEDIDYRREVAENIGIGFNLCQSSTSESGAATRFYTR